MNQFFEDCKDKDVPVKAVTYHFTNAQYSRDSYDVKRVADTFRNGILGPAGFSNLPVWITEYELNPGTVSTVIPTTPSAVAAYNDGRV